MSYRADMPVEEQQERRKAARRKWYEGNKAAILALNLGIGKLGDTVAALERVLAYLKRAQQ